MSSYVYITLFDVDYYLNVFIIIWLKLSRLPTFFKLNRSQGIGI